MYNITKYRISEQPGRSQGRELPDFWNGGANVKQFSKTLK